MSIWGLLISDTHVGSPFALWPPDFMTSNGTLVGLNKGQEYLLCNWNWALQQVNKLTGGKLGLLILVGDLVHGKQKRDEGVNLVEPDPQFQARAFLHLLEDANLKPQETHMVQGTKYHVDINAEAEEWIGLTLNAIQDDRGHYCTEWIPYLGIHGIGLDIAHHQSIVMVNRAMPLERERRYANQVSDMKRGVVHLIIRAHAHRYVFLDIDGERELGLPPVCLQDPYCKKSITPNRLLSRWIGIVALEFIPDNLGTGMSPVIPHPILFPHPDLPARIFGGEANKDDRTGLRHGRLGKRISQALGRN